MADTKEVAGPVVWFHPAQLGMLSALRAVGILNVEQLIEGCNAQLSFLAIDAIRCSDPLKGKGVDQQTP